MTGDGLLLAIALILAALLVLGVIQALRVSRPHSRHIRSRGARRVSPHSGQRAPEEVAGSIPRRLDRRPPVAQAGSLSSPASEAAPAPPGEASAPAAEITPPPTADEAFATALSSSAPSEPEESTGSSERVALLLDECRSLYAAERYRELLLLADRHLQRAAPDSDSALAELWDLAGRSRQALDDEDGARVAFEEAIRSAPESDRAAYERRLAELAASVGHRLLSRVERAPEPAPETTTGEERIMTLRQAVRWLAQGALAVSDNEDLASSLARARKGLWMAYSQTAAALLRRREFHGARRLLKEALSDADFPADVRDSFQDLLAATFTSEIEQLAAQAVRSPEGEREREAPTLLERAEGVLTSIPAEGIANERLDEVNRRLWWGYAKLGLRRVEAGQNEAALEPLFHALRIDEVDPQSQRKPRAALIQALNHVIRERASRIDQLMAEGNFETAIREGEWLRGVVEEGRKRGVREDELADALALARPIMARLDQARSGAPS